MTAAPRVRRLAVEGALEFTPRLFPDHRGVIALNYEEPLFTEAVGRPFHVHQVSVSVSRNSVVRGVHFTTTPPGTRKYVYCSRGSALDLVVDVREGSPTFGRWDSVLLDQDGFRATYFPLGVGHAYVALEDDTTLIYLMSSGYVPENEKAVSALDPELGLPIKTEHDPIMSERDTAAPTLARARDLGILPRYADCRAIETSA